MNREYILITGATGFIGSHVAEKLLSEGEYNLVAIVRRIYKYKNVAELKRRGVILVEGNFYDKNLVEKVFEKYHVQHVIHIAAVRGSGAGTEEEYNRVNVYGTEVLLEVAFSHQVKKFIFCSSVGVFGTIPSELPANVNTKLNGDNAYHRSKISGEEKVQEFIKKGLNAYIVRPTITYGLGDTGFPTTLVEMVKKRKLLLPLSGFKIHLLEVGKLAEIIKQILLVEGLSQRVFIAADNAPIALNDLVDLIYYRFYNKKYPSILKLPEPLFKILSICFRIVRNEKWLARILLISKDWCYDVSEAKKALQYCPVETEDFFLKNMCIND